MDWREQRQGGDAGEREGVTWDVLSLGWIHGVG